MRAEVGDVPWTCSVMPVQPDWASTTASRQPPHPHPQPRPKQPPFLGAVGGPACCGTVYAGGGWMAIRRGRLTAGRWNLACVGYDVEKSTTSRSGSVSVNVRMHAGLPRPSPHERWPSKSWVWRASLRTRYSPCEKSVDPVKVLEPVADWMFTSTPEVPLSVIVWPVAPSGNTGVAWRWTVSLGTAESNWSTKRS